MSTIRVFPPPPPPSLWRVTTPAGEVDVTACFCSCTEKGTLLFRDGEHQLVRAFAFGRWELCEKIIGTPPTGC
jgi:hypothetical protein